MDSRTHLDYALFQLTPTRTRCDLVIFSGGKSEKLASGLVEPFISHLKFAKDQIPKGGYSISLRPPNAHASWFTKATFQRVVRFISTPEILERFVRIEKELLQIEGSIRANELSNTDIVVYSGEAANDITKGSPDSSKIKGETGKNDVAEDENSKICLQRTLETRKVLLRKEQAMAYARALVAGYDMVNNDDLMLFSDAFGASRLRQACLEFKELCKKKLTDTLWMDELAAMAACPPSELPYLGTSGITLTSEGNNTDDLTMSDQMPSTPAKVQGQMPWQNQIPPYMYNYQNSVQGFPYPGMQPVPPFFPGQMHWSPNMDDSGHRQRRKSSSRKKNRSSETSSEEEQIASGDSDSGTEPDPAKKHDEGHSSGEKPVTRKHRKKSSKTVVIRNINYITSDKKNGEKGGDSEDDSSVNGELIDEDYLKQKVRDAVGSLEKHRRSKSHADKNKGTGENGLDDFPNDDLVNEQASGEKHSAWDALQNLLMREDDSAFSGNKEEQFGNSNAIDLGYEKGTMRKTTANDSFIVSNRVGGNVGRVNSENFANAENMRSLMGRGETVDTQLLVSRNLESSGINGQRTVSDFQPESSTIRRASGEDWYVMNQSSLSQNQGLSTEQAMFNGDYTLPTDKEKSKTVPAIDDSFMVQTRSSADENSQWRTDISMMESNVVSQSETVPQDASHVKSVTNSYEPDDLCVMLSRDSGLSPGASWAPEMDYETEISFTKADKKSAPVELNNDEVKPSPTGKKTINKKPVGPGANNAGRETRSKVLRGSLATSRSDILSKSKNRPMINKSKLEKPNVDFHHYAGYITVNEENGRALFYWFYEASTLSNEKPLVLWLNGGPGCSSVGYGATQEIGPFVVNANGADLSTNPYSWNREANMLFLESPVGVGFSYSNTTSDYDKLGDDFTANDAYTFLHKWLLKFPSLRMRAFYIAGESYAGKYVPELAGLIQENNKDSSLHINLMGILLGNPETSDAEDWKGLLDYAWSHAVVSDETHNTIRESCDFYSNNTWSNNDCSQAVDEVLKQYQEIDIFSLYTSVCIANSAASEDRVLKVMYRSTSKMMPRILGGYDPCLDDYAKSYYNKHDVQTALHVSDGHHIKNWSICNMEVFNGWKDSKGSVLPIYKELIAAGLKIWVYSGDTDGRVPVLATRYSLSTLGLLIHRSWRPWYHQRQVGGWIQEYEGLTFATFRGAGHAVPIFKPSESLALFSSFLNGQLLPLHRYLAAMGYLVENRAFSAFLLIILCSIVVFCLAY